MAEIPHAVQELVCVVEIPKGGRNKYEYDPELGGIKFDRLLSSAATYPADYGYLRGTLGQDGDPLDALVCLYEPTFPGCLIPVKPLGMFKMRDEKGIDDKIICVPLHDPYWNGYEELDELPLLLRQEIEQFFSILQGPRGPRSERRGLVPTDRSRARDRAGTGAPAGRLSRAGQLSRHGMLQVREFVAYRLEAGRDGGEARAWRGSFS